MRADLELGLVSPEAAESNYGLVFGRDGSIDEGKTKSERARRLASQVEAPIPSFDVGNERRDYDALWSAEARETLLEILAGLPILVRYRIKNEIHRALFGSPRLEPVSAREVSDRWNELRSRLYPDRYLARQFLPKSQKATAA